MGRRERKLIGIEIEVPAGTPAGLYGSFQHKELLRDMVLSVLDSDKLEERMLQRVGASDARAASGEISALTKAILKNPEQVIAIAGDSCRCSAGCLQHLHQHGRECRAPFGEGPVGG